MTEPDTLGWLGTGRMGEAMAGRLVDAGHDVTVWNRTRAKTEALVDRGARVGDTISDLATRDVVFIMVSTPRDLEEVLTGPGGLLVGAIRPKVVVDCSTVDVATSARMRTTSQEKGVSFLAAPISGNPHVVAEGESVLMASGPLSTYELARPYLDAIAKVSVYVGEGEQARLVKICHNLYLGMIVQALAEVTTLAEKSGVPREAFLHFLNNTVLGTDWVRKRTPDMLSLDWTPTFTMQLLRKDFDLGLAAARQEEVPMPMAAGVMQLIQTAIGRGLGEQDFLSLFEMEAASAGLKLGPR
jgi:3-hydroxyisobutyrate dehydrogenase-like beta-hydroxyacid dehydrogenase